MLHNDARTGRISRWLRRQPQPDSVEGFAEDDSSRRVKLTTGRYRYSDACSALYQCVRVVALDHEGNELRSLDLGAVDEEDQEEREQQEDTEQRKAELTEFRAILATEVPKLVTMFAERLESATKAAFEAGTASYKGAFDSLLGVVKVQGTVAQSSMRDQMGLLRNLQALTSAQAAPVATPAEAEQSQLNQILGMLLGQAPGLQGAIPGVPGAPAGGLDLNTIISLLQRLQPAPPAGADPHSNGVVQ